MFWLGELGLWEIKQIRIMKANRQIFQSLSFLSVLSKLAYTCSVRKIHGLVEPSSCTASISSFARFSTILQQIGLSRIIFTRFFVLSSSFSSSSPLSRMFSCIKTSAWYVSHQYPPNSKGFSFMPFRSLNSASATNPAYQIAQSSLTLLKESGYLDYRNFNSV